MAAIEMLKEMLAHGRRRTTITTEEDLNGSS